MIDLVAVDIGGTHVRFAIARVDSGRVARLEPETTFGTADFVSFEQAWQAFGASAGRPLPPAAAIAFAGPVGGDVLKLTNNPWAIRVAALNGALGVERLVLVNDFGAVAHAVAQLGADQFSHSCGPDRALPETGLISIVGPGTGLGVAQLLRRADHSHVVETEGGHVAFAPLDEREDRILAFLRARHGRVSAERLVSGSGLLSIHQALRAIDGRAAAFDDDRSLWAAALGGADEDAAAALDQFCRSLGAVAGDIALAQGADAVVIAGGLGLRLAEHLPRSGFARSFIAKGRFESRMRAVPVKLVRHAQPGLFGAAAAFATRYRG